MKRKVLQHISVTTTPEAEDAVAELLSSVLNLPASTYHDVERGDTTVAVYLPKRLDSLRRTREDISAGLRRIKSCGLAIGSGKIVIATVPRRNWAESWKRHFKPIEIEEALLIKPSWSKRRPRREQVVIVLDPGLSFGTGHHPTTAFCLSEIVRLQRDRNNAARSSGGSGSRFHLEPLSFLDLGTGSGILAIAAAKLGYSPVHALDFDPEAVRVACMNARTNQVHQQLRIRRGDVAKLPRCPRLRGQKFDLICANLISDLLTARRQHIAAQLSSSGTLVLAGILKKEFQNVRQAYEDLGLKLRSCRSEKEWCSGSFCL